MKKLNMATLIASIFLFSCSSTSTLVDDGYYSAAQRQKELNPQQQAKAVQQQAQRQAQQAAYHA